MFKVVQALFWVVAANKMRILFGDTKRNPFAILFTEFVSGYKKVFQEGDDMMKFYLVIAPFFNLFLFTWFFSFLLIMASNFYIFRLSMSK